MEVKTRNTMVGAGVGAAVGTGAGAVAGLAKTKEIRAQLKDAIKTSAMDVDTYVAGRKTAAINKMKADGLSLKHIKKALVKVAEKAKADFPAVVEKAKGSIEGLTKTRNKTFLKIAGIGVAAGTIIGAIIGKIATKNDKKAQ